MVGGGGDTGKYLKVVGVGGMKSIINTANSKVNTLKYSTFEFNDTKELDHDKFMIYMEDERENKRGVMNSRYTSFTLTDTNNIIIKDKKNKGYHYISFLPFSLSCVLPASIVESSKVTQK